MYMYVVLETKGSRCLEDKKNKVLVLVLTKSLEKFSLLHMPSW